MGSESKTKDEIEIIRDMASKIDNDKYSLLDEIMSPYADAIFDNVISKNISYYTFHSTIGINIVKICIGFLTILKQIAAVVSSQRLSAYLNKLTYEMGDDLEDHSSVTTYTFIVFTIFFLTCSSIESYLTKSVGYDSIIDENIDYQKNQINKKLPTVLKLSMETQQQQQ